MDIHQQVHMILFSAELKQLAAPRGKTVAKHLPQIGQQLRCQRLAAVLGHEHDVQLKVKDSV